MDVQEMASHYIAAMLWSTNDESTPEGGEPMDRNYDESDLADEFRAQCEADCEAFAERAAEYLTESNLTRGLRGHSIEAMAGHDFWLTRVGHGAGFWDGDWQSDAQSGLDGPLTTIAESFGTVNPYVGDDGKIYGD